MKAFLLGSEFAKLQFKFETKHPFKFRVKVLTSNIADFLCTGTAVALHTVAPLL